MESSLLIDDSAFTVSGRTRSPQRSSIGGERCPLIVAIHGGGFTSRYFDIPGYSLVERAATRGYGVIALDRLGYGRSRRDGLDAQTLAANAQFLAETIARLWPQFQTTCDGVVLVGHSIGAALAVMLAAEPQTWPLAGVAVSGAGLTPNPALNSYFERFPADAWIETSGENKDRLMFGAPGTFDGNVVAQVSAAYVLVATRELLEVNTWWPQSAHGLLQSVEVPVQFRLAEQDALWSVTAEDVRAVADWTSGAAGSSAAIVAEAGHCIDFHHVAPRFQDDQLNFARECIA